MYVFLTILKGIGIAAGLILFNIYFWPGIRGDKVKLKKAIVIFVSVCFFVLLISMLEFVIANGNSSFDINIHL